MVYAKSEIESLEFYTSRKSHRYLDYEEVNIFLKFLLNPNDLSDRIYIDYTKIIEILNSVEKLYSLCCKYGKIHKIPNIIYRQEHHFDNIIEHMDINSNYWKSESFLSFTKSMEEVDRFKFNENARLITAIIDDNVRQLHKIPFIDVTDILGEDEYLKDEQEILIPPLTLVELSYLDCNMKFLSEDYANLQQGDLELYEEVLDKFILIYKNCKFDLQQLNDTRKKLNNLFSKKLIKEKTKIMMGHL